MFDHPLFQKLKSYQFVLGSSSPRRKEILANNLNISDFIVVKSTFEENLPKHNVADIDYVTTTAEHKINSIVNQLTPGKPYVLLVADTVVSCGGHIFEKPGSREMLMEMLHHYKSHPRDIRVITAIQVCEIDSNLQVLRRLLDCEITKVIFNDQLSEAQLQYYADSDEGLDVAGGFKYQCLGSLLFSGIEGDYFNVVGLPAAKTFHMLDQLLC